MERRCYDGRQGVLCLRIRRRGTPLAATWGPLFFWFGGGGGFQFFCLVFVFFFFGSTFFPWFVFWVVFGFSMGFGMFLNRILEVRYCFVSSFSGSLV